MQKTRIRPGMFMRSCGCAVERNIRIRSNPRKKTDILAGEQNRVRREMKAQLIPDRVLHHLMKQWRNGRLAKPEKIQIILRCPSLQMMRWSKNWLSELFENHKQRNNRVRSWLEATSTELLPLWERPPAAISDTGIISIGRTKWPA